MAKVSTATEYISKQGDWQSGLILLRDLMLETGLEETIKWGAPVYTLNGKNVVGIGSFKSYFGLWFFQGSFLKDPHKLLTAQEGTRGLRSFRFNSIEDIDQDVVSEYLREAIENQKAGKEIKPEKKELKMPVELEEWLNERPEIRDGFLALTPGKQREYAEYIAEAKREATKITRLKKIGPMVLKGVGLHDKYK